MNKKKLTLQEIKARLHVVCICKGIQQEKISLAIQRGACSLAAVNHRTGSGSGGCQGKRCGPVITKILADTENKNKCEKKNEEDDTMAGQEGLEPPTS
jgi:bacterioferritin-associated ferredoxin